METIKIPISQLTEEPTRSIAYPRYSCGGFTRKIPKGIIPLDYDKDEKKIEITLDDGKDNRYWIPIEEFFGKVIANAKKIVIVHETGHEETMSIVGIDVVKIKRSLFWKLIFELDLPF